MAERGLGARSDLHKVGWELSEFPILCNVCLGDMPYLRMMKSDWEKECKICTRPFIVFRWKPNKNSRFKTTEICQTCAKVKNVCQTCLFDLQFGLPVEVRDSFLKEKIEVPKDTVNRDYWAHNMTKNLDNIELPYNKLESYPILQKFSNKKDENTKRNLPHVCSFFVKGECAREKSCPYRHEIPEVNELSEQNIKDRYYGMNDPVAKRILKGFFDSKPPKSPVDKNIRSLYISGITDESIQDKDIYTVFARYGEIKSIKILTKNFCAFVTFTEREAAEEAIKNLHNKLTIKEDKYRIAWAKISDPDMLEEEKAQIEKPIHTNASSYVTESPFFDDEKTNNPALEVNNENKKQLIYPINLNPYDKGHKPYYPSMDPKANGGELKYKSKKKLKAEERKQPNKNLGQLLQDYNDI